LKFQQAEFDADRLVVTNLQSANPMVTLDLQFLRIIKNLSPVLNTECKLDYLSKEGACYEG